MTDPLALQAQPETPPAASPTPPPAPPASGAPPAGTPPAPPTGTPAAGDPPAAPTWRDKIAGEDKGFKGVLDRYTDEAAFGKAHRALLAKMSSGELKEPPQPFPDKGTDADKAAWRTANGVPDKPEAYLEKMAPPKGVVFGDTDKPGLERLAGFATQSNWSQDQYNAVLAAYHHELAAVTTAREAADDQFHQEAQDALNGEWGTDFRRNVNAVHNLLAGAPEGVRERLMGGRTADGKLVGDDPVVLKWLAQLSLDLNPAATILPPSMSAQGFKSRLDELNNQAKDLNGPYYQAANAKELQREHLKLLEAEEKMQSRGRAA